MATDVFGRGIDIERINLAINYDMPGDADSYLHRVGRAGRFGTKGLAISFVSSDDDKKVLSAIGTRFEVAIPYVYSPRSSSRHFANAVIVSSPRKALMPAAIWLRKLYARWTAWQPACYPGRALHDDGWNLAIGAENWNVWTKFPCYWAVGRSALRPLYIRSLHVDRGTTEHVVFLPS